MIAIILAAGIGRRLQSSGHGLPKCLLEFEGRSLLQRHLQSLQAIGVGTIHICVGYQAAMIRAALEMSPYATVVSVTMNHQFERGSVLSLWTMRDQLTCGDDVLLMDADVLYAPTILQRLGQTAVANCFLLDRVFEPGDEPVKVCIDNGRIVEFRKQIDPRLSYNLIGESVGFFRFCGSKAEQLAQRTGQYVDAARLDAPYEEPIRDLLLAEPTDFGYEDITGIPWIEIDFPADIIRARDEILPLIDGR